MSKPFDPGPEPFDGGEWAADIDEGGPNGEEWTGKWYVRGGVDNDATSWMTYADDFPEENQGEKNARAIAYRMTHWAAAMALIDRLSAQRDAAEADVQRLMTEVR
ncbi:MAG: hypothetical protein JRD89_02385 [Deltaproteobacteria bacterium]|nr:hypothetical protein [Deltaproteobacteria bacterium]